jgi:hypothetical protein
MVRHRDGVARRAADPGDDGEVSASFTADTVGDRGAAP